MKTRVIVAAVGIPLLLGVVIFAPLIVFACVVGVIAAVAAYELLRCTEAELPRRITAMSMLFAFLIPVGAAFGGGNAISRAAIFLLMLFVFIELILSFNKGQTMAIESVMSVMFAAGVLPYMLGSLVRLGAIGGWVYILLPIIITISTDSCAYFAGIYLGKHKLAPRVSPNKTIEGATGGLIAGVVFSLAYCAVLRIFDVEGSFLLAACYGFLGSCISQLGDLSFSAVKRIVGIKDYGNLIPGHGGALDRFDSWVFVAPLVEVLVLWVPMVKF